MVKIKTKNLILAVIFIVGLNIFFLPCPAQASPITAENIIIATNQIRKENKIAPLTASQLLSQAAYKKAFFILQTQKFQHNFPKRRFSAWVRETGYQYNYVGENLAIYFQTTESVIKAWLNSALHRQNLLNPIYSEIGVAVVRGSFKGYPAILVVQIFAQPTFQQQGLKKFGSNLNLKPKQTSKQNYLFGQNTKTVNLLPKQLNKRYPAKTNTFFVHYQNFNFQSLKTFFFIYILLVFCLWWLGRETLYLGGLKNLNFNLHANAKKH